MFAEYRSGGRHETQPRLTSCSVLGLSCKQVIRRAERGTQHAWIAEAKHGCRRLGAAHWTCMHLKQNIETGCGKRLAASRLPVQGCRYVLQRYDGWWEAHSRCSLCMALHKQFASDLKHIRNIHEPQLRPEAMLRSMCCAQTVDKSRACDQIERESLGKHYEHRI